MPPTDVRATFTHMARNTQEEWTLIARQTQAHKLGLADRILAHMRLLGGDYGGFAVDRLTHSVQTATRAFRDGRDDEYVVCALLHDIGDSLSSFNHHELAVTILKPFASPENLWMLEHHNIFQGYYFFHYRGRDRHQRNAFSDHPWFARTAEFCAKYDGAAFDPDYVSYPLEFFEPALRRVVATPKNVQYIRPPEPL